MGCSRPGALAVACVTLAGVFAGLSLFLPYWSKITITAGAAGADQLELALGIWGSCLTVHITPINATSAGSDGVLSRRVRTTKATTSFTCASYFDTEVVGLRCTDLSGVLDDGDYSCERVTSDASESLCASSTPLALLLTNANEIESGVVTEWRGVVQNACGGYGHASVALAFATAVFTGLAFVLLVTGITCGAIESCVVRAGSTAAISAAMLQAALALVWHFEASAATDAVYGTSYYMNITSAALLAAAFVAGRTHTQLGRDAQKMLEMDFLMDIGDEKPPLESDGDESSSKTAVGPLPRQPAAAGVIAV